MSPSYADPFPGANLPFQMKWAHSSRAKAHCTAYNGRVFAGTAAMMKPRTALVHGTKACQTRQHLEISGVDKFIKFEIADAANQIAPPPVRALVHRRKRRGTRHEAPIPQRPSFSMEHAV